MLYVISNKAYLLTYKHVSDLVICHASLIIITTITAIITTIFLAITVNSESKVVLN